MYDWAISAFHTTVMAAVLPIFFRNVAVAGIAQTTRQMATSLWGYTAAIAMLVVGVLSLLLGPVADVSAQKKRFLAIFTAVGSLFTLLLSLTGSGDWIWVSAFFIVANICSAGSEVFYNALLPHISRPGDMDMISTRGYASGYVGGGVLLAINIAMIWILPKTILAGQIDPVPVLGMRLSFATVAVWWAIFSIPLFLRIPEPPGHAGGLNGQSYWRTSVKRLTETFRSIRQYRQLFIFIVAFWLYNDGIGTIIKMATAYGDEIGIGTLDLIGALLLTQMIGIPATILFGRLAGRISAKRSILAGLGVYVLISVGGFFMTRAIHFWILAGMVGVVQGGTQALSRSLFGAMVPQNRSAEFFSFYSISGKFAGVMGPAVFALVSQFTRTSRLGILSLLLFFVAGGLLLMKVDVEEDKRAAHNAG